MSYFRPDEAAAIIREAYGQVRSDTAAVAETFYGADELAGLPRGAVTLALGVGHPLRRGRREGARPGAVPEVPRDGARLRSHRRPRRYQGRTMKAAHAHLNITEKEWDRMVAVFKQVLAKHRVPAKETQELLDIVASTKADIVMTPRAK